MTCCCRLLADIQFRFPQCQLNNEKWTVNSTYKTGTNDQKDSFKLKVNSKDIPHFSCDLTILQNIRFNRLPFKSRLGEQKRNLSTCSNWQSILLIPVLLMLDTYKSHKPGGWIRAHKDSENWCLLHPWAGCNSIDNNSVKNAISPNALGKNNVCSLVPIPLPNVSLPTKPCPAHSQNKLNGLNLAAWLRDALKNYLPGLTVLQLISCRLHARSRTL